MTITPSSNWAADWYKARPHLVRVCNRVDMGIDDIYQALKTDDRYQLLMMDQGAAVISLEDDAVHIVGVAGKFKKGWAEDFTAFVLAVAMITKKPRATLNGRKGWLRVLPTLGWTPTKYGMEVYHGRSIRR